MNNIDIIVIGGGHAGCEAALAAARLGCRTLIFSSSLDAIANMPCNPNIGGSAKGHLVREIDALGGEMAKAADAACIQSRILNKSKGPAVYSLRVQTDRKAYQAVMKNALECQPNLYVRQSEVVDIVLQNGEVAGVVTHTGARYAARAVIIATGTFLRGRVIIGEYTRESGPDGLFPSVGLSESLRRIGVRVMRFKTGTPPRINAHSVDFCQMQVQEGDEPVLPLSFETMYRGVGFPVNKARCYVTYTNETTHKIIRENLHRAPLFSGVIDGVGPRYCPSIEDKITRFADKDRHQLFIEPTGLGTSEMYIAGLSTSLPEDVQQLMVNSIAGLQNAHIMRSAYAIEYDCADPLQLHPTLEFKCIPGLYGAGQFNGTSGYEEAAAQGLIAGVNAARKVIGHPPVVLRRNDAYIGVLIDDLTAKGTCEPYRMMTARSEHRLLLRQDNADSRLTPLGYEIGLIDQQRYSQFKSRECATEAAIQYFSRTVVPPSDYVNDFLAKHNSSCIATGVHLCDLLRRPELDTHALAEIDGYAATLPRHVAEQAEIRIKYQGYINKQNMQAQRQNKLEGRKLPPDMDYHSVTGLRIEARQKLSQSRPATIGQAARISGVTPADIAVLIAVTS